MKTISVRLTTQDLNMIENLKNLVTKEYQEIGMPLEITTSDILRAALRRSYDQIVMDHIESNKKDT